MAQKKHAYRTDSAFVTLTFPQNNKFTHEFTVAFLKFLSVHLPKDKIILDYRNTHLHQNYVISLDTSDIKYLNDLANIKAKEVFSCVQK